MDFTQRQIMLSLAYVAYTDQLLLTGSPSLDAQILADIESTLSANATTPIPPVAGQWSVVWGPVTYTVPGALYQDNLMYVVRLNQDPSDHGPAQYAIAVRGTNGTVLLDWLLEDFDVIQTMPWPPGATGSDVVGQISESTSIGLTILLNMQDGTTGQTLLEFLTQKIQHATDTPISVCCTGHSLGAALSSTLALYLRDNQSTWDPDSKTIVTTINFAGPTAGDANFAAYFDQQFSYTGDSPLPFWVSPTTPNSYADCVRTSLDIAPLVWNATSMQNQIEDIYLGHGIHDIPAPLGTSEIIGYIVDATQANAYTRSRPLRRRWREPSSIKPNCRQGSAVSLGWRRRSTSTTAPIHRSWTCRHSWWCFPSGRSVQLAVSICSSTPLSKTAPCVQRRSRAPLTQVADWPTMA